MLLCHTQIKATGSLQPKINWIFFDAHHLMLRKTVAPQHNCRLWAAIPILIQGQAQRNQGKLNDVLWALLQPGAKPR